MKEAHIAETDQRVAIIGSTTYNDPRGVISYVLSLPAYTTIVTGGDPGVAHWAEKTARMIGLNRINIKPSVRPHISWITSCRECATEVLATADRVVAFISKDDTSMIDEARATKKKLLVMRDHEVDDEGEEAPSEITSPPVVGWTDEHDVLDTTSS